MKRLLLLATLLWLGAGCVAIERQAGEAGPTPDAELPPPDTSTDAAPDAACAGIELKVTFFEVTPPRPGPLRFGDAVTLEALVSGADVPARFAVDPPALTPFLVDHGDGSASFALTEVGPGFATTVVTFRAIAHHEACQLEVASAAEGFTLLGNLWVAVGDTPQVRVFRSDGSALDNPVTGLPGDEGAELTALLQVGDEVLVGAHNRPGVFVVNREGDRLRDFSTVDADGNTLWTQGGTTALMVHRPDGHVWVGGPAGRLLVFDIDGTHLQTLTLPRAGGRAAALVQLQHNATALLWDSPDPWDLALLDPQGNPLGAFAALSGQLPLVVADVSPAHGGGVLAIGAAPPKGFLVRVSDNGGLVEQSEATTGFLPAHDVIAFGPDYLVATNKGELALFGQDLTLLVPSFTGDVTGDFRALLLLRLE